MRTSAEVLDAINVLEGRFPVHAWCAGDIDLWPSYRFRLHGNAMRKVLSVDANARRQSRLLALAERAFRSLYRVPLATVRDWRQNAVVQPECAAVFLSDGISFVRLEDRWYDRVVDPVMELYQERGQRTLKLTPMPEAHAPRHMPSKFVQPTLDFIKFRASSPRLEFVTPEFDAFQRAARDIFGELVPPRDWLQVEAARLDALARWFGKVLAKCGARHAFVNMYYSLEGLAFVQAARRRAVRTIDLQHGIQGPHHIAYARWLVQSQGYSTLPHEFWVWGEEEAAAINSWRPASLAHSARIVGNFWMRRWMRSDDPIVRRYIARARALRSSQPGATHVLVCLTWGVPPTEESKLIEAAQLLATTGASANPIVWWWRVHPVRVGDCRDFASKLAAHGLDGALVSDVTDLPLYALLQATDVTIAHSSTVIREAVEFGVPSIVSSQYGAELHSQLIREGIAVVATDAHAISQAVLNIRTQSRPGRTTTDLAKDALRCAVERIASVSG